jgi:hypothetical protein
VLERGLELVLALVSRLQLILALESVLEWGPEFVLAGVRIDRGIG